MKQSIIDFLLLVLTACGPVLATIASGLLWSLWTKMGLQGVAIDKANMEAEIHAALGFGIEQLIPTIRAKGWSDPEAQKLILKMATGYFMQRFPDRTAQITAATQDHFKQQGTPPVQAVTDTLSARLQTALSVAAASPGTPPVVAQ